MRRADRRLPAIDAACLGLLLLLVGGPLNAQSDGEHGLDAEILETGVPEDTAASLGGDPEAAREALRLRLQEDDVALRESAPGFAGYIRHVTRRGLERLTGWLTGKADRLGSWVRWIATVGPPVLVGILLMALLALLFRSRPRQQIDSDPADEPAERLAPSPSASPLEAWQANVEEHLRAGNAVAALEALWWWWSVRLGAENADPSWTTRELLGAVDRRDLRSLGRRFDFLAYGTEPVVSEVQALWRDLRETGS